MDILLQKAILTFTQILNRNWLQVYELAEAVPNRDVHEFLADWAQSSWEMLVEAAVAASSDEPVYLQPYGEGADCNEIGSRVWRPGVVSTHAIHIIPSRGSDLKDVLTGCNLSLPKGGIPLEHFVRPTEDGWYRPEPPFDHALIFYNEEEIVVPVADICFLLQPMAKQE